MAQSPSMPHGFGDDIELPLLAAAASIATQDDPHDSSNCENEYTQSGLGDSLERNTSQFVQKNPISLHETGSESHPGPSISEGISSQANHDDTFSQPQANSSHRENDFAHNPLLAQPTGNEAPPMFNPVWLHANILTGFAATFLALGVALAITYALSRKYHGFSTHNLKNQYIWNYGMFDITAWCQLAN